MNKSFLVLFFKKELLSFASFYIRHRPALRFANAGSVALWMLAGCALGPPAKPDVVGLLRRVARIGDLTDYEDVSSDLGIPYDLSVQYSTDKKGQLRRNVVSMISNKAVADVVGVMVVSYEVQVAGGPAAMVPDGDEHVAQARLVLAMSGKDDCVQQGDLIQRFGAGHVAVPVEGGWGLQEEWMVREGRRFRTTLQATFGSDQCATSILVHQVRRVG